MADVGANPLRARTSKPPSAAAPGHSRQQALKRSASVAPPWGPAQSSGTALLPQREVDRPLNAATLAEFLAEFVGPTWPRLQVIRHLELLHSKDILEGKEIVRPEVLLTTRRPVGLNTKESPVKNSETPDRSGWFGL